MSIVRFSQLLFTVALVFAGKLSGQNAVTIRVGHFPNVTHVQALVAHAFSRQGKGWFEERLGAGTKIAAIAHDAKIKEHFPALAHAAGGVATPQIRHMATLGGNLCQRNRCWYFRDEHVNCKLKSGSTCFGLETD